ncbi:MAG: tetratricopeptide repeat protein, partial [Myxococcales bacterium]
LELNQEEKAAAVVERFGQVLPGDPSGFKLLGQFFVEKGALDKAERYLERARECDPNDFEVRVTLGRIAELNERLALAALHYEAALRRQPDDLDVLFALGTLSLRQRDPEAARAWFDQLLAQAWDDASARARVAFAYLKSGRLPEAAEYFRQAQKLSADDPTLPFFLGRVLEEMRDYASAVTAYAAVPADAEIHPQAVVHQASCLTRLKQHDKAVALLKASQRKEPGRQEYLLALAAGLESAGRPKEAMEALEKRISESPGASPLLYEALA